jgi:hypothetical protein
MISCACRFDEDPPDDDEAEGIVLERFIDDNGCPAERRLIGGQEVIVHYDDIPDRDRTVVDGIPVTTALRTVIDLAVSLDRAHLERIVEDCLARQLFTIEEASARLAEPDMRERRGALLLAEVIRRCPRRWRVGRPRRPVPA